jgi:hypothetical protein
MRSRLQQLVGAPARICSRKTDSDLAVRSTDRGRLVVPHCVYEGLHFRADKTRVALQEKAQPREQWPPKPSIRTWLSGALFAFAIIAPEPKISRSAA